MEELALSPIGYALVLTFAIILLSILAKSKTFVEIEIEPELEEQEKPAYLSRIGRVIQM